MKRPNWIRRHPNTTIIAAEKRPIARKARIRGGDPAGENAFVLFCDEEPEPQFGGGGGGGVAVGASAVLPVCVCVCSAIDGDVQQEPCVCAQTSSPPTYRSVRTSTVYQ
jgi:hypothetical protein